MAEKIGRYSSLQDKRFEKKRRSRKERSSTKSALVNDDEKLPKKGSNGKSSIKGWND